VTAPHDTDLIVNDELSIPLSEIRFTTSRSSGPGGQNVNKVESRVTLIFDLGSSRSLTTDQEQRIRHRLSTRITLAGVLRVVSQRHRTQGANRKAAQERFIDLLAQTLAPRKPRRATATPKNAKRQRLKEKRERSKLKATRRKPRLE